jgi:hypothetical protein
MPRSIVAFHVLGFLHHTKNMMDKNARFLFGFATLAITKSIRPPTD